MMTSALTKPGERSINLRLRTADILLVHTKRSLWGWIIRKATRCYWNHALMVCSAGNPAEGAGATLIFDTKTSGGVEIDYAEKYFGRPDKYDVAVKRMEMDWFQELGHDKPDMCGRICNIALNEVSIKLGSRMGDLIDKSIRQLTVIYRFLRRKFFGYRSLKHIPRVFRPSDMKAFTCGGFVQWCYYEAAAQSLFGSDRLEAVLFNRRIGSRVTSFELLTTTPADLAESNKLSWKYLIKSGVLTGVNGAAKAIATATR